MASKDKILPPKSDLVFKWIFGDKNNIEILKAFLKAILNLDDEDLEILTIEDTHLKRRKKDDKLSILDVLLTTKTGKIIHIEIQVAKQEFLPERIVFYNSSTISRQLKAGDPYSKLMKTITIAIADFEIIVGSDNYFHKFQLLEEDTKIKFSDIVEINTLELNKLPENSDNSPKYDWVKFLKAENPAELEAIGAKNKTIKKACDEVMRLSQSKKAWADYDAHEKALHDLNSRISSAERAAKREIAINGLTMGLTKEQIAKLTLLPLAEVERIKSELKL